MFPDLSCLCRLAALRIVEIGLVSSGMSVLVCKGFCRIVCLADFVGVCVRMSVGVFYFFYLSVSLYVLF